jgi:hypothetical protein
MKIGLLIAFSGAQLAAIGASTNSMSNTLSNAPAGNRFDGFKIIAERNIFNPNRSSRGTRNAEGETRPASRVESFALVGTMLYAEKQLAFFDSPSAGYKKVLKPGETIAGYKLNEVLPGGIKLEADGKTIDLAIGQQLRRENEGEWQVGGKPAGETINASDTSSTSGSSSSSSDDDELVKRLMKKREEEMNK